MRPKTMLAAVLLFAVFLMAQPLTAELFTVKLANGSSFETRYEPAAAEWDESKVVFLSDVGNWIAVDRSEVLEVISEVNSRGFGLVIDSSTIAIGWAPNDAPEAEEETAADPAARLLDYLEARDAQRPNYNVDQFVEPSQAGSGGLPAWDLAVPGRGVRDVDLLAPGIPGPTRFPAAEGGTEVLEPDSVPD